MNASGQIEREPEFESEMLLDILFDEKGVVRKEKATIAHNLRDFVEGINPSSLALIVGNDGVNARTPDYPWLELLGQWMDNGCQIEYLLVAANDLTISLLTGLNRSHPKGSLKVCMPDWTRALPKDTEVWLREWRTFHFIVFENPKQLWIECCHRPGELQAERCAFFPEAAAKSTALFDVFRARFKYVTKTGCKEVS